MRRAVATAGGRDLWKSQQMDLKLNTAQPDLAMLPTRLRTFGLAALMRHAVLLLILPALLACGEPADSPGPAGAVDTDVAALRQAAAGGNADAQYRLALRNAVMRQRNTNSAASTRWTGPRGMTGRRRCGCARPPNRDTLLRSTAWGCSMLLVVECPPMRRKPTPG